MMRIDLPAPLKPGGTFVFDVAWWYNINDRMQDGGRSGYEYFDEEDNYCTLSPSFTSFGGIHGQRGWQTRSSGLR